MCYWLKQDVSASFYNILLLDWISLIMSLALKNTTQIWLPPPPPPHPQQNNQKQNKNTATTTMQWALYPV